MPSSMMSPASTRSMPGAAATPLPAAIACRRLRRSAAGISPSTTSTRRGRGARQLRKRAAGGDRMRDAERDVGLAGAAHGVEQHQALLGNDRIEHHAALRDVEREQLGEVERGELRGAGRVAGAGQRRDGGVRRRRKRRRIGNDGERRRRRLGAGGDHVFVLGHGVSFLLVNELVGIAGGGAGARAVDGIVGEGSASGAVPGETRRSQAQPPGPALSAGCAPRALEIRNGRLQPAGVVAVVGRGRYCSCGTADRAPGRRQWQ